MQRSSTEVQLQSSPIAQPSQSAQASLPMGYALPGQTVAPMPMGRSWPTLVELVNALKRRMVLATFLGVLVGLAAGAGVWLALPAGKHQVKALVQMKPFTPILGQAPVGNDGFESFKATQETLIKQRSLLEQVVSAEGVRNLTLISESDDPIRYLDEQLRTRWEGGGDILSVMLNGDDPEQLKIVLTTLLDMYVKKANQEQTQIRARRMEELRNIKDTVDKKIVQLESDIATAKKGSGSSDDSVKEALLRAANSELTTKNTEISNASVQISTIQRTLARLQQQLKTLENRQFTEAEIAERIGSDLNFKAAQQAVVLAEQNYRNAEQRYEPGNQRLAEAKRGWESAAQELKVMLEKLKPSTVDKLRQEISNETSQQLVAAEADLKQQQDYLASLEEQEKSLQARLQGLVASIGVASEAKEELLDQKAYQTKLSENIQDLEAANRAEAQVSIREKPAIILNQNLRQKVLLSMAGVVVGTSLIMLIVAFLEWRSRRVDSVDQIVNELGIRVIGTIPAFPSKASLRSGDAAQSQNWRFILNESVNSARTMLLHAAKTQDMQVLMVSSAMQGEGKTSLASQLATSMATAGLRTLILDGDLRNPSMHKLFDAPLTPGCSEILCQEIDVSEAVQPTAVANLWLIPAGQCSNRVIASLAQGHPLETLFNRLRGQFDFIVVDSCPVLPVADALLIGQHVDGVLMSIMQDISQLPKVQIAAEKMMQLNIPIARRGRQRYQTGHSRLRLQLRETVAGLKF